MNEKRDYAQEITSKIIAQIEAGAGTFEMPWHKLGGSNSMPINGTSGHEYQGINVLTLGMAQMGMSSHKWGTFKQWQGKKRSVAKGEKGFPVVFFKHLEREAREGEKADKDGNVHIPMMRFSTVFNECQLVDYEEPEMPARPNLVNDMEAVEAWVQNTGANVITKGDRACYIPFRDEINMPARELFKGTATSTPTESYYSTLLHELTHWTGHKSRLDRLAIAKKEAYAFEELIAELGAAFQCMRLGVTVEPRVDHAQYLEGWLHALKKDKKHIFKAAAAAQRAVDHIHSLQGEALAQAA